MCITEILIILTNYENFQCCTSPLRCTVLTQTILISLLSFLTDLFEAGVRSQR